MVAKWYFTRGSTSVRSAASAFMSSVHARGWARGQYLGHHIFCLIFQTSWWMNIILGILGQCDTLTWNYVCRLVTYISWSSDFALLSDLELSTYFCLYWFVEVWYENICEYSKVRYRPVVQSKREARSSMYFGQISTVLLTVFSTCFLGKIFAKKWLL